MKRLNFGNIDYEYITLEKSSHIPENLLCKDNENNLGCIKDEIEIISYIDENLTFKYKNREISKNVAKNCIENSDKNATALHIQQMQIQLLNSIILKRFQR